MSLSDPIGDLLARIKNASLRNHATVKCLGSKMAAEVVRVLEVEGYIRGYKVVDEGNGKKSIQVELKYHEGLPAIKELKRVSKPGRRSYSQVRELKSPYNGLGINIVSTSKGIMSDTMAREANVGGEVLCSVF